MTEPTKDYNLEAQSAIIDAELAMEYEGQSNEYRQALAQLATAKAIMALEDALKTLGMRITWGA